MQAIATPRVPSALVLSLAGCFLFSPPLQAQQLERYTVLGGEVAVYNIAGDVRVEPGQGPGVVVEVTRGGADAVQIKVLQGEIDGRKTLRLVYPGERILYPKLANGSSTQLRVRDDGTFSDSDEDDGEKRRREGRKVTVAGSGGGLDAHANLRLLVPPDRELSVYLATGKVAVSNVHGDLSVDVASGPVTSSDTRGELDIDVGSGAVQVAQSRGDLSVNTGSGSVALSDVRGESVSIDTGAGEVTGTDIRSNQLSIDTGSGDIQVNALVAPQVALETGSGAVTADISGEVWNVNVETGSGDVTLKMPPTLGAEVDIETSSGDIETDFEVAVTRHARDKMTGRIGDGRGKIAIETGSGGIKLVKGGS